MMTFSTLSATKISACHQLPLDEFTDNDDAKNLVKMSSFSGGWIVAGQEWSGKTKGEYEIKCLWENIALF